MMTTKFGRDAKAQQEEATSNNRASKFFMAVPVSDFQERRDADESSGDSSLAIRTNQGAEPSPFRLDR